MLFAKAPYAKFVCPPIQNAARKQFLKNEIKQYLKHITRKCFLKKERAALTFKFVINVQIPIV